MSRRRRRMEMLMAWLACTAWLLPASPVYSEDAPAEATAPPVSDVRLDRQGTLRGQLVNLRGQPVADQRLELHLGGQKIASTSSRADGEFRFQRLRAGVYQIRLESCAAACRAWTADAAPPAAKSHLIMLSEPLTVRGQQPIHEIFRNPLFIGLVVAAAIAIPVAINNSQDDRPSGS